MIQTFSGAQALAHAALAAGVRLVSGYPGSPATAVVNALLRHSAPEQMHIEWNSNEKVALETAFGASLGGRRSLLCVKSVGLNIALDPLMTLNLSGCNAGMVLLVGDDPGSWGSQNEQDSRWLARLTEIPWLEPTTVANGYAAMREAFTLSEEIGLPVVVRITRALALAQGAVALEPPADSSPARAFQRGFMRWVVLPVNVVPLHDRLLERLQVVQTRFEGSPLNRAAGEGARGIIAAGFAYQKLMDLLGGQLPPGLRILSLGTLHPLPEQRLTTFLRTLRSVLILEESAAVVEREVRALAQSAGMSLPICGRESGHVPATGELFGAEIARALNAFDPDLGLAIPAETTRPMPSRRPLCDGCPYIPTFDALKAEMAARGGESCFIVVGDPGCMVRAQMPPYRLLDVKHGLGSAIGMATGLALAQRGTGGRVVALCGDSGFLHSGFGGLVDAARADVPLLVLILDNGTTALSGGQPHPGSALDARGAPRPGVDLVGLAREAGARHVELVDLDAGADVQPALANGLDYGGVAVVVVRGQCRPSS
jgi:indolepyruvate ferredoxin oxidoreductase alpha subunit